MNNFPAEDNADEAINLDNFFNVEIEDNEMPFQLDSALKMIPEFHGNRNDLHKFLACCDIVAASCTTQNHQESLINVIKTKLCGAAYNLIKYKNFATWADLKPILQQQYLEKRTIAQLQTELVNSRQRSNEDVITFANRLERLTLDLTDACITSEGEDAADVIQSLNNKCCLKAFVDGLNNPIRLVIKASRFPTFEEAVAAACEEERSTKTSKFHNNFRTTNQINCFKCGKRNHKAEDCYSSLPRYPKTEIKTETNINKVNVTCRYCKKPGHTIEQCRKRQYNNSRAQNSNSYTNPNRSSSSNNSTPGTSSSGNETRPAAQGNYRQVRDM